MKHVHPFPVYLVAVLPFLTDVLGYVASTDLDYDSCAPDLQGLGGAVNPCKSSTCCKQECDNDPSCGVYMFGSVSWCSDCCWRKSAPTCRTMVAFPRVRTYTKITG